MPAKGSRPVAVITVLPPTQTVAGVAEALAATGVPVQGVSKRRLSKPISVPPKSEVAWKRMIVVAEVLLTVYSFSVQEANCPSAGDVNVVKLVPPLMEKDTSKASDPVPLMYANFNFVLPVAVDMST